jgi:hypothetical protein
MEDLTHGPLLMLGFLVVVAAVLFTAGHVLAKRRRAPPVVIGIEKRKTMLPLMDAAAGVYKAAKKERMVIVTLAENTDAAGPVEWFAQSIASVVPVYREGESNTFEKLEGRTGVGLQPQSLYIRKTDYKRYVRWARSVQ